MTVKQGEDINQRFTLLTDSIKKINEKTNLDKIENGQRLQKAYNDYSFELNNHKIARSESDSFKVMYLANRKIYLNAEEDHKREVRNLFFFTILSFFITGYMAATRQLIESYFDKESLEGIC